MELGSLFLTWIWGIFNNSFIAFLVLVPFLSIVWCFVCGYKGNEWAWNNKEWKSVEHFHKAQKKWARAGIIVFIITLVLPILLPVLIILAASPAALPGVIFAALSIMSGNYHPANQTLNQNALISNATISRNAMLQKPEDPLKKLVDEAMNDKEKTVTIKTDSLGRTNPFKPYEENVTVKSTVERPPDVPPPPEYNPDSPVVKMMKIKVNGILYNSKGSSSIINIDGSDYLVHKGDTLFGYYIKDITSDKIAIAYGNNVYKAGIGEIIDGDGSINVNPEGTISRFSSYPDTIPKLPSIKLTNPTYFPSKNK